MLKYAIQADRMNEVMELLFHVLDLRITFFDLQGCEVDSFNIKEMSPFCCHTRRSPDFNARCIACDQEHLQTARQTHSVHVYYCHAGLLEGIVPLYDRHGIYLGAIVFGQLRDRGRCYDLGNKTSERLLARHRESSFKEMRDTGRLLKYLSEYIIENEIVRYCNKPWAERLQNYIHDHLDERLTLAKLAKEIGCSASFLSHNIPKELGVPLKQYVRQERMERAKELLWHGSTVRETALELGYYDEFHFSKEFKRYFGQPPSSFKR